MNRRASVITRPHSNSSTVRLVCFIDQLPRMCPKGHEMTSGHIDRSQPGIPKLGLKTLSSGEVRVKLEITNVRREGSR